MVLLSLEASALALPLTVGSLPSGPRNGTGLNMSAATVYATMQLRRRRPWLHTGQKLVEGVTFGVSGEFGGNVAAQLERLGRATPMAIAAITTPRRL